VGEGRRQHKGLRRRSSEAEESARTAEEGETTANSEA
jgi:hypothetical protein